MSKFNFLLYGNCQICVFGMWPKLKKNQEIFEKLKNSDYFIFQDVMDKERFISSEDLYKKSNCKNLCVTNFYFNYNEKEKSLKELKKRANKSKQKYNEFLDVTDFIEKIKKLYPNIKLYKDI